jgi:hypothetical protein
MQKWFVVVAALAAVVFAVPAHAIVQETNITVNKTGTELAGDTIKVTVKQEGRPDQSVTVQRGRPLARKPVRIDSDKPATVVFENQDKPQQNRQRTVDGGVLLRDGIDLGGGVTLTSTPSTARGPGPSTPPGTAGPGRTVTPITPAGGVNGSSGTPGGVYIAITGAGTGNETSFTPIDYVSANVKDAKNNVKVSTSETNFGVGFIMGFFMPNVGIFNRIALEAEFALLNNKSEIPGLPGLIGFPTATNDVLRFEKEWMLTMSMLVFMPEQYPLWRDFYIKLGIALVKERFEYDCRANGFCGAAPATPAFAASDSTLALGFLIGLGYQWQLQQVGLPNMFLRIGWDHIFVGSNDMQAGNGATRFVAGAVENDVDRFYVTLAIALGGYGSRDMVR